MQGIKCALDFFDEYNAKLPIESVILGDFNAKPDSETIELTVAHKLLTDMSKNLSITFHGYSGRTEKIDYIFATKELANNALSVEIWDDSCNGIFLSDHYPVCFKTKL